MVNLKTNYWELYPRRENIFLQSLERLSEGVGVEIMLHSSMEGFSHFLYSINDAPFQKSVDGRIIIGFEDRHTPEIQQTNSMVKAVSRTGVSSKLYTIAINYYPKELCTANGQTSPGHVIIRNTDLVLSSSRVEDYILQHPTPEEKKYARNKWGHLMANARSDYKNACALANPIIDDLEPHRGMPSDEINKLSPFKQYERAMAGKGYLWCGNIAGIFEYACNALGILCRHISLSHPWRTDSERGYQVLLAGGHGTTEIFNKQLNHWIWMDLAFYILGAYLREEGPINMAEFYWYLNDPNRVKSLRIVIYDPKTKMKKTVSVLESDKRDSLFASFKRDQQFHYYRKRR